MKISLFAKQTNIYSPWIQQDTLAKISLKVVSATFLLVCFVYLKKNACETK